VRMHSSELNNRNNHVWVARFAPDRHEWSELENIRIPTEEELNDR
jgi:hypothetical protein